MALYILGGSFAMYCTYCNQPRGIRAREFAGEKEDGGDPFFCCSDRPRSLFALLLGARLPHYPKELTAAWRLPRADNFFALVESLQRSEKALLLLMMMMMSCLPVLGR